MAAAGTGSATGGGLGVLRLEGHQDRSGLCPARPAVSRLREVTGGGPRLFLSECKQGSGLSLFESHFEREHKCKFFRACTASVDRFRLPWVWLSRPAPPVRCTCLQPFFHTVSNYKRFQIIEGDVRTADLNLLVRFSAECTQECAAPLLGLTPAGCWPACWPACSPCRAQPILGVSLIYASASWLYALLPVLPCCCPAARVLPGSIHPLLTQYQPISYFSHPVMCLPCR